MGKKTARHHAGFTDEERRLRVRMLEMGLRQKDLADALGLPRQNVLAVIRGYSLCPLYVAEVYKYLGLEQPEKED